MEEGIKYTGCSRVKVRDALGLLTEEGSMTYDGVHHLNWSRFEQKERMQGKNAPVPLKLTPVTKKADSTQNENEQEEDNPAAARLRLLSYRATLKQYARQHRDGAEPFIFSNADFSDLRKSCGISRYDIDALVATHFFVYQGGGLAIASLSEPVSNSSKIPEYKPPEDGEARKLAFTHMLERGEKPREQKSTLGGLILAGVPEAVIKSLLNEGSIDFDGKYYAPNKRGLGKYVPEALHQKTEPVLSNYTPEELHTLRSALRSLYDEMGTDRDIRIGEVVRQVGEKAYDGLTTGGYLNVNGKTCRITKRTVEYLNTGTPR